MAKRAKRIGIRRRQSDEPYSVDYFARKHDISVEQARELMRKTAVTAKNSTKLLQRFFASRPQRGRLKRW